MSALRSAVNYITCSRIWPFMSCNDYHSDARGVAAHFGGRRGKVDHFWFTSFSEKDEDGLPILHTDRIIRIDMTRLEKPFQFFIEIMSLETYDEMIRRCRQEGLIYR